MSNNQDNEIFQEFLIESFENLSNISDEITQFEKEPDQMDLLNSIYRKVHTVKGSASFLNYKKLQSVTHVSENLLDLIREGNLKINMDIVDILLGNFDICIEILKIIELTGEEGEEDYSHVVSKTLGVLEKYTLPEETIEEEIVLLDDSTASNDKIIEQSESKKETEEIMVTKEEVFSKPVVVESISDSPKEVKPREAEASLPDKKDKTKDKIKNKQSKKSVESSAVPVKRKGVADSVVKVNVQLLDRIMNVVGELVLNRNQIMQYAHSHESSELNRLAIQLNGITSELQQDVMTTRMQPVGTVLNKFERIVRDLARQQGKKIQLKLTGQDTELDKSLIESIRDPLTHLIRNSVDHGIEKPVDRIDNGKSEEGSINIKAYHEGGQVTIEIQDDGNGIHSDKILEKAISKGVVSSDRAPLMSEQEVLNLIFSPGFSTAEKVTSISGRGVGMDVVKSNIEKIRGTVEISSIPGEGTSFKLKIPLTLAIVPSLIVNDDGETYAIPQINLVELVRIDSKNEGQIERVHDSEFYRLRTCLIPIFRLKSVLSQGVKHNDSASDDSENHAQNIVILNADGVLFGLVVDTILDTEEIVVKPLSKKLKSINIYAGATIMGDGNVALILDALGFYSHVSKNNEETKDLIDKHVDKAKETYEESQEYVLCKLFDGEVYAFPLCYVNRLEEFSGKNIEQSGDISLIRYREMATPLLDVSSLFSEEKMEFDDIQGIKTHPTIVVENNGSFIGLVVDEIQDIAICFENINSDVYSGNGVLGTVYINEKTITVLDLHGILDHFGFSMKNSNIIAGKKGARILLLEDSPLYQKMICELFSGYEHDFVVCDDGEIGLDKIQNDGKFDLVLSDINMPNVDGPSFMKKVRAKKNEEYCDIPIIAISTGLKQEEIEKNIKDGFDEYVEKNMQEEIINAVQKLLVA